MKKPAEVQLDGPSPNSEIPSRKELHVQPTDLNRSQQIIPADASVSPNALSSTSPLTDAANRVVETWNPAGTRTTFTRTRRADRRAWRMALRFALVAISARGLA